MWRSQSRFPARIRSGRSWNLAAAVVDGKPYVTLEGYADWPPVPVPERHTGAWAMKLKELEAAHARLCGKFDGLAEDLLRKDIPGQNYSYRVLLRGIANHSLYHAGQIGLLKKAAL